MTDSNAANKFLFFSFVPQGVDSLYVEIFDEVIKRIMLIYSILFV